MAGGARRSRYIDPICTPDPNTPLSPNNARCLSGDPALIIRAIIDRADACGVACDNFFPPKPNKLRSFSSAARHGGSPRADIPGRVHFLAGTFYLILIEFLN